MAISANLGFPRIGIKRELKRAVERLWSGKIDLSEMLATSRELRNSHWMLQRDAGIDHIPSNDFSLYDHVLDTIALVGAVPPRFGWKGGKVDHDTYFAMARGTAAAPAMEMTKWFDTNYHYIVPELAPDQHFALSSGKPFDEFREARELGIHTRPVLLGPVSFLLLGKLTDSGSDTLALLDRLLPVYGEVLNKLAAEGADWVQIDEPVLALDLPEAVLESFQRAYAALREQAPELKICLTSYFAVLGGNAETALSLPVDALHVDLVRAPEQLDTLLPKLPADLMLSLGVIDGRNIWRANLPEVLKTVQKAAHALGGKRIIVAPSCSLLHCPIDLDMETELDDELKGWMAFAKQKLAEIAVLAKAVNDGADSVSRVLHESSVWHLTREASSRIHKPEVRERLDSIDDSTMRRQSPYAVRSEKQRAKLGLPLLPTTTIGSYPQTAEIRQARSAYTRGKMSEAEYEHFLRERMAETIKFQEEIDLDVLVHGEYERNDMVEYFGEQLEGFAFTGYGWVQSYGSRCVKPPVIYGDVTRPTPMTVEWSSRAQSMTDRPVKGMLTGPVTITQWSFVRDDQPREQTAYQIALAIRDEVADLEAAGIGIIQIDEPAFREGLPLRREGWKKYLDWAVSAFLIASCVADDATQIHTHMCYSEFNEFIEPIAALDADVISIEASRSNMELLDAFVRFDYPNEIGPGVYDIHSPRVPSTEGITKRLRKALEVLKPGQLWVNPDCGLKTRGWPEITDSLKNMVAAAKTLRSEL